MASPFMYFMLLQEKTGTVVCWTCALFGHTADECTCPEGCPNEKHSAALTRRSVS